MKKSELNLNVLENFVLWYTHKNRDEAKNEGGLKDLHQLTAERFYKAIDDYIEEDHVDGKGNYEDHIVTFGAESSFVTEDTDQAFEENVVVVADYGDDGTQTVCTISGTENLESVNDLLEMVKDPWGNKRI